MSSSKGDSPVTAEATGASSEPTSKAAVPSSEPAFQNAEEGAASPVTTTEIDGFSIEEVPDRSVEYTEQDHNHNNRADDSFDWVIEGGEDLDGDTR